MPLSGTVVAFFLFDVAEAISLAQVPTLVGSTSAAQLTSKVVTPRYIQYQQPPVIVDGPAIGMDDVRGFRARFKLFDYGVVSVALTRPLPATWDRLLDEGMQWHDDPALAEAAERCCRLLIDRLAPAIVRPRAAFLGEDYLVFALTADGQEPGVDVLVGAHGAEVAQLLRGEREPLSAQEREEVLRHRISYFASDLVIATWNAALIHDTEAGIQGVLELVEFANSQLLEFRYYDQLLDGELARIYGQLQTGGWLDNWSGRRYTRAARKVHGLFIDVNELTDKTENALKIAGDVYAARVFALTAARLGLDQWKGNVKEKLQTLDDIYRFAVERTAMARGEFLELTIVLILILELVLFFAGIME
jgi:hypothetical protein